MRAAIHLHNDDPANRRTALRARCTSHGRADTAFEVLELFVSFGEDGVSHEVFELFCPSVDDLRAIAKACNDGIEHIERDRRIAETEAFIRSTGSPNPGTGLRGA